MKIVWAKDGKVIDEKKDERVKINNKDDVYFLEVAKSAVEDSGKYTVTVSNKSGGSVEENVDVTVTLPAEEAKQATEEANTEALVKLPEFSSKPETVSVSEGETILIKFSLVKGNNCTLLNGLNRMQQ